MGRAEFWRGVEISHLLKMKNDILGPLPRRAEMYLAFLYAWKRREEEEKAAKIMVEKGD